MHMRHCYGVLRSYLLNRTYYKYTVEYTLHNEKLAYFCVTKLRKECNLLEMSVG